MKSFPTCHISMWTQTIYGTQTKPQQKTHRINITD
jgi:hypothetical protein